MKLPNVVTGLIVLGCMVPAIAVVMAVAMWKDRTTGLTLAAAAFFVVSIPVALFVARRFFHPPGVSGIVDV